MRDLGTLAVLVCLIGAAGAGTGADRRTSFKKLVLDTEFRSEGVAAADVNHDGKTDILAGNLWYEAPRWTPREIAPVQQFDKAKGYSNSFVNFAADVDGDGWSDQILVDFPGTKPVVWRENPRGRPGHWPEHVVFRNACNESPAFAPLPAGTAAPVLVFAHDDSQMAWYERTADAAAPFVAHLIGDRAAGDAETLRRAGVHRYAHGLGVGDLDGDGRRDVLIPTGYWKSPADPRSGAWRFVTAGLGRDCAQMHVADFNGDGLADVATSSAHGVGVWWHEQRRRGDGSPEFVEHVIDRSFSQSHALVMADVNGDGLPDLVTGKRFWAHGPTGDVDPSAPAVLFWYELARAGGTVRWIPHQIDDDSGVGTQFVVADLDGDRRPDIAVANKKGVFVFLQEPR